MDVCGGRIYNGPNKAYGRCARCGHVDYEAYEGDTCRRRLSASDRARIAKTAADPALRGK